MILDGTLRRAGVWRAGERSLSAIRAVPSGCAALDAQLPGGGWPLGALIEVLAARGGLGALALFLPALARLGREGARWIVFVAPPHLPYAPALAAAGLELARVLVIDAAGALRDARRTGEAAPAAALWAFEQALRSGACTAALGWFPRVEMIALRRLQLAAEAGAALAVAFRPAVAAAAPSPAALRIALEAHDGEVCARVLKCRGGHRPPGAVSLRRLFEPRRETAQSPATRGAAVN